MLIPGVISLVGIFATIQIVTQGCTQWLHRIITKHPERALRLVTMLLDAWYMYGSQQTFEERESSRDILEFRLNKQSAGASWPTQNK